MTLLITYDGIQYTHTHTHLSVNNMFFVLQTFYSMKTWGKLFLDQVTVSMIDKYLTNFSRMKILLTYLVYV